MGTAVVTDVRTAVRADAVDEAMGFLHWVDATFSVYRRESEVSRIGRGGLDTDEAEVAVREVLTTCTELRSLTEGWFDHEPRFPGARRLDPSAYVKGWAVDRAVEILADAGAGRLSMSAGGDVAVLAGQQSEAAWRVAIQHPERRDAIVAVVGLSSGGIATSGLYERGRHIWHPAGAAHTRKLASVSVVGPELGIADALATAVFAAGDPTAGWLDRFPAYGVIAVDAGGMLWASPGVELLDAGRTVA
jgi:thiamine biosynthesis lipoprotein